MLREKEEFRSRWWSLSSAVYVRTFILSSPAHAA